MVSRIGENLLSISGHTRAVKALAWSPQEIIWPLEEDGALRVWDLMHEKKGLTGIWHGRPIEDLAWSPDGNYLASCGHDLLVRVWNVAEGEYLGAFTERIKKPFYMKRALNLL